MLQVPAGESREHTQRGAVAPGSGDDNDWMAAWVAKGEALEAMEASVALPQGAEPLPAGHTFAAIFETIRVRVNDCDVGELRDWLGNMKKLADDVDVKQKAVESDNPTWSPWMGSPELRFFIEFMSSALMRKEAKARGWE